MRGCWHTDQHQAAWIWGASCLEELVAQHLGVVVLRCLGPPPHHWRKSPVPRKRELVQPLSLGKACSQVTHCRLGQQTEGLSHCGSLLLWDHVEGLTISYRFIDHFFFLSFPLAPPTLYPAILFLLLLLINCPLISFLTIYTVLFLFLVPACPHSSPSTYCSV